jgi:hypothetical protein
LMVNYDGETNTFKQVRSLQVMLFVAVAVSSVSNA